MPLYKLFGNMNAQFESIPRCQFVPVMTVSRSPKKISALVSSGLQALTHTCVCVCVCVCVFLGFIAVVQLLQR